MLVGEGLQRRGVVRGGEGSPRFRKKWVEGKAFGKMSNQRGEVSGHTMNGKRED